MDWASAEGLDIVPRLATWGCREQHKTDGACVSEILTAYRGEGSGC